jgi:hypothetical protein
VVWFACRTPVGFWCRLHLRDGGVRLRTVAGRDRHPRLGHVGRHLGDRRWRLDDVGAVPRFLQRRNRGSLRRLEFVHHGFLGH